MNTSIQYMYCMAALTVQLHPLVSDAEWVTFRHKLNKNYLVNVSLLVYRVLGLVLYQDASSSEFKTTLGVAPQTLEIFLGFSEDGQEMWRSLRGSHTMREHLNQQLNTCKQKDIPPLLDSGLGPWLLEKAKLVSAADMPTRQLRVQAQDALKQASVHKQENTQLKKQLQIMEAAQRATAAASHTQSAVDSACVTKVLLVLLHHTGLSNEEVWHAWLQCLAKHILVLFHLCKGAGDIGQADDCMPGQAVFGQQMVPHRYEAKWGEASMVVATIKCMQDILEEYPNVEHIMVASGTHLPLSSDPFSITKPGESIIPRMPATTQAVVAAAEASMFSTGMQRANVAPKTAAEAKDIIAGLLIHHQWCALASRHVRMLVQALPWLSAVSTAILGGFRHQDSQGQLVRVAPDEFALGLTLYNMGVTEQQQPEAGRLVINKFTCGAYFEKNMVDHPIVFRFVELPCYQVYEEGKKPVAKSLLELMQACKANKIPFIRKVDIEIESEKQKLLSKLATDFWPSSG